MTFETQEKSYGSDIEGLREAARDRVASEDAGTQQPEGPVTTPESNVRDAAAVRAEWRRQREEERRIFNGEDTPNTKGLPPVATNPETGLPGDLDLNDPDALNRFIEGKEAELAAMEGSYSDLDAAAAKVLEQRQAIRDAKAKLAEAKEMVSPAQEPPPETAQPGRAMREFQLTNAAITQDFATRFPEVRTPEDFAYLAQFNPERAAEVQSYLEAARPIYEARAQEAAVEQHQIAWDAEAEQHDAAFIALHPQLKDPARKQATADAALQYLTEELGFSQDVIVAAWNNNIGPLAGIRTLQGQKLLYDASQRWASAKGLKSKPRPTAPAVQRPRVRGEVGEAQGEVVRALDRKLAKKS